MPDYPPIPAGKGVLLIDTATSLPDSTAVLAAFDDRYIGDDTGWVALSNGAGFTALDSIPSAYRIKGGEVYIRVSASGTIPNATAIVVASGLPVAAQPAATTGIVRFFTALGSGGFPGVAYVFPAGHTDAGKVYVYNSTGADRSWASSIGRFPQD